MIKILDKKECEQELSSIKSRAKECKKIIKETRNPVLKNLKSIELDYLVNLIDLYGREVK